MSKTSVPTNLQLQLLVSQSSKSSPTSSKRAEVRPNDDPANLIIPNEKEMCDDSFAKTSIRTPFFQQSCTVADIGSF